MNNASESVQDDPLDLWLPLEIRRADATLAARTERDDEHAISTGNRRSGGRIKMAVNALSDVMSILVKATWGQADQFGSPFDARERAQDRLLRFFSKRADQIKALTFYVAPDSPSVYRASLALVDALRSDVEAAYKLACRNSNAPSPKAVGPVAEHSPKKPAGKRSGPKPRPYELALKEKFEKYHGSLVDLSERDRHRETLKLFGHYDPKPPGSPRTTQRLWVDHLQRRAAQK